MAENKSENIMKQVSQFIVDKRNAFYIIFFVAVLYCATSISKVEINNDITVYLPEEAETRIGLEIMNEEFIEYGSATIMISNITYSQAEEISEYITNIKGIASVIFDETEDHYKNASALFSVMFDGETDDPISVSAMKKINEHIEEYDTYISTMVGLNMTETLEEEMRVILLLATVVIIVVLMITSKSYMEILVFIIVFAVSAILNMGTNYWFGQVSFITNSIAVVLQLALAIDYAIIFCHRYMEERETKDAREATIESLSKAIVEISASSLTTISGLLALTLMQLRIGFDMGIVLAKGIVCSLITVFLLMPGLLILFDKGIEKTRHKNFIPNINVWGKIVIKLRYILPFIFIFILIGSYIFAGRCEYVFSINTLDLKDPPDDRIALDKIRDTFGENNPIVVLVPSGDYEKERIILDQIGDLAEINSAMGLANIEIELDESSYIKYSLTEEMNPRQFAEMSGIDVEISRLLYDAYGLKNEEYGAIFNKNDFTIPLIDIFMFLCEQIDKNVVSIDDEEKTDGINMAYEVLQKAEAQLQGKNWSRLIFSANLPEESPESFELLDTIRELATLQYDDVVLVGNTTSAKDLSDSFQSDNIKITILTIIFVMAVLLFTFKSAGLPILLVMTIQGSIWINFSFPYLLDTNFYFLAYLIVSSIQMGATIDYAIVITNRYMDLKTIMSRHEATIEALNQGFPTVLTSGSIMTVAGFLLYFVSSDGTIGSVGLVLGRGTLISIILVMTVLPQILLLGDTLIERTAFTLSKNLKEVVNNDVIKLDGHIKGNISGYIDAELKGVIKGSIEAEVESNIKESSNEKNDRMKEKEVDSYELQK